ncbi:MAG: peptidylprolyl isomerase [Bacteroidales bacterium]|nr:peptidylprolyl isomerase [Bacteroidales bacterium]
MHKLIFILITFISVQTFAQNDTIIIDQIVARVGDEIILQSDVEGTYQQWLSMGNYANQKAKCNIFEDLLIQSLLLNQAKLDSIVVTDAELDMQADARINMFLSQFGSEQEMENYLNKSMHDIREGMKKSLKKQLIADQEKSLIIGDITVTPADIAIYYASLPSDSLPLVDVTYEIRQIVIYPKLTATQEQVTIDILNEHRDKIINGTRQFASMARMYSKDPGSAANGGELGFKNRNEFDPDFAAVAFSLDSGEVSQVFKTQFGFHIVQMIERRGERVNVRHILLRPYIPADVQLNTVNYADSLRNLALADSISFAELAMLYSEDVKTQNSGGLFYNPNTESTKFKITELPTNIKYDVINLNQGDISNPIVTTDDAGNTVIKLYMIEKKIPAHVANLRSDYDLIAKMALTDKQNNIFNEWVDDQLKQLYISIDDQYKNCNFKYNHWIKTN